MNVSKRWLVGFCAGALALNGVACGSEDGTGSESSGGSGGSGNAAATGGAGGSTSTGGSAGSTSTGGAAGSTGGAGGSAGSSSTGGAAGSSGGSAGSTGTGGSAGTAGSGGTSGSGGLEPWDTSNAGPLSGIFALEFTIKANLVVPLESRQLYRFRVLQDGNTTTTRVKMQLCELKLPSVPGVATVTVPPALDTLIQSKTSEFTGSYLSAGSPVGATFSPPLFLSIMGANLANPVSDPLPTTASPGTAIDEDGDGHPGVTFDATAVICAGTQQLYVAVKTGARFDATISSLDAFAGALTPTLDQSVLGYSNQCLSSSATLQPTITPGSTMKGQRVADSQDTDHDGNVSCAEISAAAPALFGNYWQ